MEIQNIPSFMLKLKSVKYKMNIKQSKTFKYIMYPPVLFLIQEENIYYGIKLDLKCNDQK